MPKLIETYQAADSWQATTLEEKARAFAETAGVKLGAVAQPLRAALTGSTQSPPIFEVMEILGKDEALARLREAPTV
jgi:glutamyl-tRNA synthetase